MGLPGSCSKTWAVGEFTLTAVMKASSASELLLSESNLKRSVNCGDVGWGEEIAVLVCMLVSNTFWPLVEVGGSALCQPTFFPLVKQLGMNL